MKGTGHTGTIHAIYTRHGSSNQNITSAVKAGTYSTGLVDPGDHVQIIVRVTVDANAGPGTKFLITTKSAGSSPDTVKAVVTTHN